MPERGRKRSDGRALSAAMTAAIIIAIGAVIIFLPFVLTGRRPVTTMADTQTERSQIEIAFFRLEPRQRACLSDVTVTPNSRFALFRPQPVNGDRHGGPPLQLLITGRGYATSSLLPGGYSAEAPGVARSEQEEHKERRPAAEEAQAQEEGVSKGSTARREGREEHEYGRPLTPQQEVAIRAPRRALISTACFADVGRRPVFLDGTREARLESRSKLTLDGRPVPGVVSLSFVAAHAQSRLSRLGEIFEHASNLTDGLVPVWLVWIIVLAALGGIPAGIVSALHRGLTEDEAAAGG